MSEDKKIINDNEEVTAENLKNENKIIKNIVKYQDCMDKKVYFISDLHLGAKTLTSPRESEKRVVEWLDSIKDKASAIYLLGDILDYWFEYRSVVPKGYVRFLGKLAELADDGVELYIFTGNHDIWMFDYLQKTIGATIIRDSYETVIYGKKFFMAHGDGLGDPSKSFKFLRCFFRNKT